MSRPEGVPAGPAGPAVGTGRATLLEVVGATKRFGALTAVDGADLTVGRAEIVGLVGGNGAGKSTLIHLIAGVDRPDGGQFLMEGRPLRPGSPAEARRHGIETVYQDLALLDELDVTANMFLGREWRRGVPGLRWLAEKSMKIEAEELICRLGYDFGAATRVRTLSGGQRQAVALARALLARAKLILMDEPTAALGVAETRKTLDLIRRFRDEGISLIVIGHELEDIFAIADRIVVMRKGATVSDLRARSTNPDEVVSLMLKGPLPA